MSEFLPDQRLRLEALRLAIQAVAAERWLGQNYIVEQAEVFREFLAGDYPATTKFNTSALRKTSDFAMSEGGFETLGVKVEVGLPLKQAPVAAGIPESNDLLGNVESNPLRAPAVFQVRDPDVVAHGLTPSVVRGNSTVAEAGDAASVPGGGLWK